jgi:chromosome segregation ATPase
MNELEAKLNQIADNLLVQTRLVERFERRTEDGLAEHERRMDRIETALESLANGSLKLQAVASVHEERLDRIDRTLESMAEGYQNLQAALRGLVETIERFIRGQEGDGRG